MNLYSLFCWQLFFFFFCMIMDTLAMLPNHWAFPSEMPGLLSEPLNSMFLFRISFHIRAYIFLMVFKLQAKVSHMHSGPSEVKRGCQISWNWNHSSYELTCELWELNPEPLTEQQVLIYLSRPYSSDLEVVFLCLFSISPFIMFKYFLSLFKVSSHCVLMHLLCHFLLYFYWLTFLLVVRPIFPWLFIFNNVKLAHMLLSVCTSVIFLPQCWV